MEEKKKNDILEYVDKIMEKENIEIYKRSRGTIIMKNGFIFQVGQMFNFFRDSWFAYTKAELEIDDDKRFEYLKMVNGGVITNGLATIDLAEVSAMMAENKESELRFQEMDYMDDEGIDLEDIYSEFDEGDSLSEDFSSN
jgi:hypothetical protein